MVLDDLEHLVGRGGIQARGRSLEFAFWSGPFLARPNARWRYFGTKKKDSHNAIVGQFWIPS